ncbi:hypothetical protein NDU88_003118 [Pleurodeles waltl]|uniref:Uncharacterized protein n=1 Tax=Pleurodeles waltl TaxID=8319 RepID=A0AAV7T5L2_PLEWA|nr:hypothetical protein NDU88_003118 [Pleurodeles waltl]
MGNKALRHPYTRWRHLDCGAILVLNTCIFAQESVSEYANSKQQLCKSVAAPNNPGYTKGPPDNCLAHRFTTGTVAGA